MKRALRILCYGLLILSAFAMAFPFIWMLLNSFNSESNIFKSPPSLLPDLLGTSRMWENYATVLREFHFARYSLNSLVISGLSALGQVVTCSLAGFVFALMKFRGKNLIFSAILLTMMVPVQVTIIPEFFVMMKLGWLDSYLPLIVPSVLVGSFGTFMFKEFYENIPPSLADAGIIDGAGPFTMYAKIYLPQSASQAATLFIIAFMNSWNDLLRPMLYISGDKLQTVTMALTQFQSQYSAKWNLLLAGSVLGVLPLLLMYVFLQRYIIESTVSSGIKG